MSMYDNVLKHTAGYLKGRKIIDDVLAPFEPHKRRGVSSARRRSVAGRPCYAAVQPGSDRVTNVDPLVVSLYGPVPNSHAETCTYTTPAYRADRLRVRKARKVSKASRRANR